MRFGASGPWCLCSSSFLGHLFITSQMWGRRRREDSSHSHWELEKKVLPSCQMHLPSAECFTARLVCQVIVEQCGHFCCSLSASVFCPMLLEGSSLVEINTPRESSPEFIIPRPGISLGNARAVYLASKQRGKGSGDLVATNQLFIFCGESFKCEGALTQKKEQSNVLKSTAFHLQKVLFSACLWNLSQMF